MAEPTVHPLYRGPAFFTVEVYGLIFEVDTLDEALILFRQMRMARCDAEGRTLNLVAWTERSGPDGGPPTGYILDQHVWEVPGRG